MTKGEADGSHQGSYWAATTGPDGQVTWWQWRCGLCHDGFGILTDEQEISDSLDAHLATHTDPE